MSLKVTYFWSQASSKTCVRGKRCQNLKILADAVFKFIFPLGFKFKKFAQFLIMQKLSLT